MKNLLSKILTALLIASIVVTTSAQQIPPPSKKAATVQRKAQSLAPRSPISVIPIQGEEAYGTFVSSNAEQFTFYDIDRKTEVTLKYTEVRKIKNGYGGYNTISGRHTDRIKALIVVVAVVAALGALIGAVATTKD